MIEQQNGHGSIPEIRNDIQNAQRKVAIVGAGPAGLSCAYFLARLGYRPEVFEASTRAGGLLVQGIPAYRLPRETVAMDVLFVESMGATIRTGKRLGRDFSLQDLRARGYEAVFLGIGAPNGWKLGVPGEDAVGVVDAMRFLREYNESGKTDVGKRVTVIGGGNSAIDAARTALRLGAESVTVLYRRARDEMPAYREEVYEAECEGIRIKFLALVREVVLDARGVVGVKCAQAALGPFDQSGRRSPVVSGAPDFVEPCDQVIVAVGQALDETSIAGLTLNGSQYLDADAKTGRTSVRWVFAGGDMTTGPSSVVEAVAGGERAAVGIDEMLTGSQHAFWRRYTEVGTSFDPEADPVVAPRARQRLVPVAQRSRSFREVELSWDQAEGRREASRCLRCDYRGNC
jgi:NADH-quinone oxidoreductase subunit F